VSTPSGRNIDILGKSRGWHGRLRDAGWALATGFAIAACSSPPGESADGSPVTSCVPGQSVACAGPGGCEGTQVCASDGKFGACGCGEDRDSGARDARLDAKVADAGIDGSVSDTPTDSGKDGTLVDITMDSAAEAASEERADATGTDGRYDALPGDAVLEAPPEGGLDGAPDSGTDSAGSDSAGGDGSTRADAGGSTVTCTFTSTPSGIPECAACYPSTEAFSVTETNVPIYVDEPCEVENLLDPSMMYGLVVEAPAIWSDWAAASTSGGGNSFCIGTSSTYPGELVAQPYELEIDGSFSGFISVNGTAASVSISGSNDSPFCGSVLAGCVIRTVTCSGEGTALPSNCLTDNGGCDYHATCAWTGPTTNSCTCNTGYTGDGITCTPVPNPCLSDGGGGCSVNATCADDAGTAVCTCNAGYIGDGINCVAVP
jgi:hypothetical protein